MREINHYHTNFSPNCTWRAVVDVLVITPADPDTPGGVNVIRLGVLKLARLRILKISARNCKFNRSRSCVFLITEKSHVASPGPASPSRLALPQNPLAAGGCRNTLGLNHCAGVPRIGFPVQLSYNPSNDGDTRNPV